MSETAAMPMEPGQLLGDYGILQQRVEVDEVEAELLTQQLSSDLDLPGEVVAAQAADNSSDDYPGSQTAVSPPEANAASGERAEPVTATQVQAQAETACPTSKENPTMNAPIPTALPFAADTPGIDLVAEKVRSFIAEGDEISGNVRCREGLCIAGLVKGDIECDSGAIVLTGTGKVLGSIRGKENVYINGRVGEEDEAVNGTGPLIHTPGMVVLQDEAVVNANIEYGKLASSGDMTHNGNVRKIASSPTR